MNNGINTRCEQFKQAIINDINNSQLPVGVAYYILQNIMQQVEKTYYGALNTEAMQQSAEEEEETKQEE